MSDNLDWTTFNKRININNSRSEIFNSWVTQENLEKWFLRRAQFYKMDASKRDYNAKIQKGDTYEWQWFGSDFKAEGKIISIDTEKQQLRFTFLGCMVDIAVKTEEDEHILQITQSEIPLDEESRMSYYVGCSRGWTFYSVNLKSILEGGIDLRNKNKNLNNVINT